MIFSPFLSALYRHSGCFTDAAKCRTKPAGTCHPLNGFQGLGCCYVIGCHWHEPNFHYHVLSLLALQNKLGDTALHAAAWKGYADIVEALLAKGNCIS